MSAMFPSDYAAAGKSRPPVSQKDRTNQTARSAEDLKVEIDRLFELQREALGKATFLGVSPEEAMRMERRRNRISLLLGELARLPK